MSQPQSVRTCQQVLTNGHLCKCPALRTASLCYYHHRDLQRRRIIEKAREVQRSYDKHRESRTEEEFNAEVVESLDLPALDDRASIQVACTNVMRAVYCNHITAAKARIMMRAITEANLCLRRGNLLDEYKQPVLECDPEPIAPLGDSDGCVLPEQRELKKAIVDNRRHNAARADAEIAAARARGEDPAPRPLTPEEEQQRALDAERERSFLEMDALYAQVMATHPPESEFYQRAQRDRAYLAAHRAQPGTAVPHRPHPSKSPTSLRGFS
jgi:hypothetical protein